MSQTLLKQFILGSVDKRVNTTVEEGQYHRAVVQHTGEIHAIAEIHYHNSLFMVSLLGCASMTSCAELGRIIQTQ